MSQNPPVSLPSPPTPTWKQRYWAWHGRRRRAQRDAQMQRRLAALRRQAQAAPRFHPGTLRLDGLTIHYDDLLSLYMEYKHIFAWGIYDFRPATPRPRVLDCGAHIGLSALRFKQLAPDARIVAFEPDPPALERLQRNLADNDITDVEIVPAALATGAGESHFVADGTDGGALTANANAATQTVRTVKLSDYLDEPVALLKMNIEGAETAVLREAADRLHRCDQVILEYHGFPEVGQHLHEILALLDACGFRYLLHHFDHETNRAVQPPFDIREGTRFFTLVAATRLWARRDKAPGATSDATPRVAAPAGDAADPAIACEPRSRVFGFDRGQTIDRYYIEQFLAAHATDIRGRVLEVAERTYTERFGRERVTGSDILHVWPDHGATIVADLTNAPQIASATFDCLVLTQVLPFIYDFQAALREVHRILRPGGTLLLTVPCLSQVSQFDAQRWGDYWRFTPQGVLRLLQDVFPPEDVTLQVFGNLRSACAHLDGCAVHEVPRAQLDHVDPDYPVIVAARAARTADA
jgi:FkbM family methyltransferase